MSFQHSSAGLSNLHIFAGVDAIVFVEGGESRSITDVRSGQFDSTSTDVAFWQKCFSEFGPQITLQFRAVGAKPTLIDLAREVATGSVTSVYVAMDRDFDHLLGLEIRAPRVLYTFGYSWENDVWRQSVLEEVFYTLCNTCRTTVKVNQTIVSSFSGFERDLRWPTYADYICVKHGVAMLPRSGAQRLMKNTRAAPPALEKAALRRCVRDARSKRSAAVNAGDRIKLNPLVDCCGHLISVLGYSLLVHLLKRFCKGTTYPRSIVNSLAIDRLFSEIRRGGFQELRTHYQEQLTR